MLIENPKTYKNHEVETIFFRPSFCGKSAEELGIRVLYNLPMPTTVQVWSRPDNVLQAYAGGWSGGKNATKLQKTIPMHKVKAESSFSAEDYFSMVFELITNSADVNLGDLTGTELEKAETELFRRAIAESVRVTMWAGDTDGGISSFNTFDGFLKAIDRGISGTSVEMKAASYADGDYKSVAERFEKLWTMSSPWSQNACQCPGLQCQCVPMSCAMMMWTQGRMLSPQVCAKCQMWCCHDWPLCPMCRGSL